MKQSDGYADLDWRIVASATPEHRPAILHYFRTTQDLVEFLKAIPQPGLN